MSNLMLTQEQLKALNDKLSNKIPEIFNYFGLEYNESTKLYYRECAVHGGDANAALNVYKTGNWVCRTQGCHQVFRNSIIGLIRGLLSRRKLNWNAPGDATVSFKDTLKFCIDFVHCKVQELESQEINECDEFIAQNKKLYPVVEPGNYHDINYVRQTLKIPDEYLINRGFSPQILSRYDIGSCEDPKKKFFNRAVFPIFDDAHKKVIGFTARSHYTECPKCHHYHCISQNCPQKEEKRKFTKWLHSYKAPVDSSLYNYWFAKDEISKTNTVILVEGPLDVLRLVVAGVKNCLAIYGVNLFTERQQIILEKLPILKIIVMMDNDEPGRQCSDRIYNKMKDIYQVVIPEYPGHDVEQLDENVLRTILATV